MVKGVAFFLLLMFTGITAFAVEGGVDIANIEQDLRPGIIKSEAPPPAVIEKYEYYEVRGNCEKELRSQMSQNGTKWNDGKTYDALTSWSWDWDYGYERTAEGCLVDSFKTDIHIIFRYPKWVRNDDAPGALIEKWDGYMKNLILHENGHRDMAVEAAREFSSAVAQLPPAASCADLDRQVKALGTERMARLNAASSEYDATTIHGSTQGAVFP